MGFLQKYLDSYRLERLSDDDKNSLTKIENQVETIVKNNDSADFDKCLKEFGPVIADMIERFGKQFRSISEFNLKNIGNIFKFVLNISTEIQQILTQIKPCLSFYGTAIEIRAKEKLFGQQLVYFVWMTINPLKYQLTWVPFKKTIEKKLIFWLSGMSLDYALDLFDAMSKPKEMSISKNLINIKLL